jgi:hypothetical protein
VPTNDSIFRLQKIVDISEITEKATHTGNTIAFIAVCISLFFLAIIASVYRKKTILLFQSLFSARIFSQLLREGKILNERIYLYSILFMLPLQALFIGTITTLLFPNILNTLSYSNIMAAALVAAIIDYVGKNSIVTLILKLYEYDEDRPIYVLNKLFFHLCNCGFHLIILPIILFCKYTNIVFLYIPIFLTTSIFLIIRIFSLKMRKIGALQFFLYFCTLEILPYLLFLKIVSLWAK